MEPASELLFQCYIDLAAATYQLGDLEDAGRLLTVALEILGGLGKGDRESAPVLNRLAVIRARQGRYSDAERLLKRLLLDTAAETASLEQATYAFNLGMVYRYQGRLDDARRQFEQALSIAERNKEPEDLIPAWSMDQIGELDAAEGDLPKALFTLKRALAAKGEVVGRDDWDSGVTFRKIAETYCSKERYNEAETFFLRAIAIREEVLGWTDPSMAKPLAKLAQLYLRQGKHERAERLMEHALTLLESVLPPDHPDMANCLTLLAEAKRGLGRFSQADALSQLVQQSHAPGGKLAPARAIVQAQEELDLLLQGKFVLPGGTGNWGG